jgi:hypothetical protein
MGLSHLVLFFQWGSTLMVSHNWSHIYLLFIIYLNGGCGAANHRQEQTTTPVSHANNKRVINHILKEWETLTLPKASW